ncbi:hypothetical protein M0802_007954 [Mischocyttarus mexicanus]|nr:hypothetical protein M0802_007954 [Mischocyttarus mexicanus]
MIFRGSIRLSEKMKLIFNPYYLKINKVIDKVNNYEMPKRFKGTMVERWGNYWKNLFIDYKEAITNAANDCRERPIRATIYTTVLASAYYLCKHNPDEESFRNDILLNATMLVLVGENVRNEKSVEHIELLERYYNEGIIRRLSFGIFSVIWLDDYHHDCYLYKTVCPYLGVHYLKFLERIIDIGFLDSWWILERKMINYDINDNEFDTLELNQK